MTIDSRRDGEPFQRRAISLKLELSLWVSGSVVVLTLLMGLVVLHIDRARMEHDLTTSAATMADSLATALPMPVWNVDLPTIEAIVRAEAGRNQAVTWIWVRCGVRNSHGLHHHEDGSWSWQPEAEPPGIGDEQRRFDARSPGPDVVLAFDHRPFEIALERRRNEILTVALVLGVAMTLVATLVIQRRLVRRFDHLASVIAQSPELAGSAQVVDDPLATLAAGADRLVRRLTGVVASLGSGVVTTNRELRVERCNTVARHLLDYTGPETGSDLVILLGGLEDGQGVYEQIVKTSRQHHGIVVEEVRSKDGQRVMQLTARAILGGKQGDGVVVVLTDLTALHAAHVEVAAHRERLQAVVDGAEVGLWDWDISRGELVINDRWASMLGRTLAELSPITYRTYVDLVHPEDLPVAEARLADHLAGRSPNYEVELRMRHRENRWMWILTKGRVVARSADGSPLRASGTHLDITVRKEAEQVLRRSHDDLEALVLFRTAELRDSQQRFAEASRQAGMAQVAAHILHNVGNVLTSITIRSHVLHDQCRNRSTFFERCPDLLDQILTHPQAEVLATADPRLGRVIEQWPALREALEREGAARRNDLAQLCQMVQNINGIIQQQQRYAKGQFLIAIHDLNEITKEALTILQPAMERSGISLSWTALADGTCATDRHHLIEVLVNLLTNAMESVTSMDVRKITLIGERTSEHLRLTITDTGQGIAHEDRERIFQGGFTTKPTGTGIGLHSCAANLQAMGGSIAASSPGPGLGASFTITVPLRLPSSA